MAASVRESIPTILWLLGILIVGALLAIFFVFRTLFTDGPSNPWHLQYLVAHGLTFAAYLLAGFVPLRFAKFAGPVLLVPLLVPATAIIVLYAEPSVAMRALTFTAVVLGAGAGAWLGSWLAGRSAERVTASD